MRLPTSFFFYYTEIIHIIVGDSADNLTKQTQEDDFYAHIVKQTLQYSQYTMTSGVSYVEPAIIDTQYTDNYVQAAYVANKVHGLLILKQKNGLIDAKGLIDSEMTGCIVPLHAITGCDWKESFFQHVVKTS